MSVVFIIFSYVYISPGSLETHLWCGGMYSNYLIANCTQSVSVKEF